MHIELQNRNFKKVFPLLSPCQNLIQKKTTSHLVLLLLNLHRQSLSPLGHVESTLAFHQYLISEIVGKSISKINRGKKKCLMKWMWWPKSCTVRLFLLCIRKHVYSKMNLGNFFHFFLSSYSFDACFWCQLQWLCLKGFYSRIFA